MGHSGQAYKGLYVYIFNYPSTGVLEVYASKQRANDALKNAFKHIEGIEYVKDEEGLYTVYLNKKKSIVAAKVSLHCTK